jgi:ketosteroid isomerase-like protein
MTDDRRAIALALFDAWDTGDRAAIEALLADDFRFHSPPDPDLDRAGYFERCWPQHGGIARRDAVRVIESGDEVVVTYEAQRPGEDAFRNTEVITIRDDGRIATVEVYFGYAVPGPRNV